LTQLAVFKHSQTGIRSVSANQQHQHHRGRKFSEKILLTTDAQNEMRAVMETLSF